MKLSNAGKCAVTGVLTGIVNGFFGAGGGIILVTLLLRWIKMDEKSALATSVAIIAPLCAVSAVVYALKGTLDLSEALPFLVGGFFGGVVGGKVFKNVSATLLRRAFGLLIVYGGIRALLA